MYFYPDGRPKPKPVPMELVCEHCGVPHVDFGEWETRPHRTHLCAYCGKTWTPFPYYTVGVALLPDEDEENTMHEKFAPLCTAVVPDGIAQPYCGRTEEAPEHNLVNPDPNVKIHPYEHTDRPRRAAR